MTVLIDCVILVKRLYIHDIYTRKLMERRVIISPPYYILYLVMSDCFHK